MGCGKSYTGARLAERLDVPFIDLDERIEAATGQPIRDYVAARGLAAFRRQEADCLRALPPTNTVVACGGGTPTYGDNLDYLNAHGISCYLDTPVALLSARLLPEIDRRPLLHGQTAATLPGFIERHLAARLPFYRGAHLRYTQRTGKEPIAAELATYMGRITGH